MKKCNFLKSLIAIISVLSMIIVGSVSVFAETAGTFEGTIDFKASPYLVNSSVNDKAALISEDTVFTYINDESQEFEVTVHGANIQYGNGAAQYGTKLSVGKSVLSFTVSEAKMYTVTVNSTANPDTVGLYSDSACSNAVTTADFENNVASIIYKKKNAGAETLYFGTTGSNVHIGTIAIKSEELPEETNVNTTGSVEGVEATDTNVTLTLKSASDTKKVTVADYSATGVELIVGETYSVTAVGDKAVYNGNSFEATETGVADIVLDRILVDFPLDFATNFDDTTLYIKNMGGENTTITDAYSGITINKVMMSTFGANYGVSARANDLITFTAKETGTCTVSFKATAGTNTVILKVNGVEQGSAVEATLNTIVEVSADVTVGDTVTINSPTLSNLYYSYVDVAYTPASACVVEDLSIVELDAEAGKYLVYAAVTEENAATLSKVGFVVANKETLTADEVTNATKLGETDTVYSAIECAGDNYTVDGKSVYGAVINGVEAGYYVSAYCVTTEDALSYTDAAALA